MSGYAMAGGAILGGIAGAQKDKVKNSSGINIGAASLQEQEAQNVLMSRFRELGQMTDAGPGMQDITASLGANRGLADLFAQMQQSGGLPNANDIGQANNIGGQLFQGQRVGMQNAFQDQLTSANRQAALMGRAGNDPILRAKLAQEQMRMSGQLDANQNSFAQQMALNLPGQRLGFAQQRAGLLGGLATQAMANRQALAAMGEGIQNNERNFRLATATRWNSQESGGGFKGAVSGALAGAGAAGSMGSAMGGGGGGGMAGAGGGAAASQASVAYGQQAQGLSGGMNLGANNNLMNQMNLGAAPQMAHGVGQGGLPWMHNPVSGQTQIGYALNPANRRY